MRNIAPDIFRQRLLIEGYYAISVDRDVVAAFLLDLAETLNLRTYGEPIVFSPGSGMGREENAGYDGFVPLIDSGIAAYVWSGQKFFSVVVYTCKGFDAQAAVAFTSRFFAVEGECVHQAF